MSCNSSAGLEIEFGWIFSPHAVQLTRKQRRLLAEKAKGIDSETLKQISVVDVEDLNSSELDTDSTENR